MGVYLGRDLIYLVMPTKVDAILSLMRQEQTEFRGRDADLVVVVDCQIRTDDLIVHLF